MTKLFAGCAAIALTLACAGAGPPVQVAPNALRGSSDSVAGAFARQLTLWGFTTAQQDSSGLGVVKGSLRLPHGRKLAGHPFGYWADCGKELGLLSRASTADEMQIEIVAVVHPREVPLQDEDPLRSQASARASFTAYDRQALGDPAIWCSSRGLLEQALLNAGHAQDKAPPDRRLTPEGPYALSPRPGDSLSLPVAENPRLANPASLKECGWDSVEQPYMAAKGEVTYAVTSEGIPDTATLAVRSLQGVDSATFQGAARRLVANCRFHARTVASGEPPGLVIQRLFFAASDALTPSYMFPRDSFVSPDHPIGSQIEPAEIILCPLPPGLPPGRVVLQFVVGLDGKPEPSTVHAVNATSPELARVAPGLITDCRFTVAHWKGRPVRSVIQLPLRVGPGAQPAE